MITPETLLLIAQLCITPKMPEQIGCQVYFVRCVQAQTPISECIKDRGVQLQGHAARKVQAEKVLKRGE